jgi:hypothetical protein
MAAELGGPAGIDARLTRIGLAVLARVDPRTLVIVGGEYRVGRDRLRARTDGSADFDWTASDRSFYHLRGRGAVEAEVRPWLTLRAAVTYLRADDEQQRVLLAETPLRESRIETTVATPLSLGLGVRHAGWSLDLAWNDRSPLNDGLSGFGPLAGTEGAYSALSLAVGF